MQIINRNKVERFAKRQSGLRSVCEAWLTVVEDVEWNSGEEVNESYPTADYHGKHKRFVFDMGKYRLIAQINFLLRTVTVDDIKEHDDYMKWSKSKSKSK